MKRYSKSFQSRPFRIDHFVLCRRQIFILFSFIVKIYIEYYFIKQPRSWFGNRSNTFWCIIVTIICWFANKTKLWFRTNCGYDFNLKRMRTEPNSTEIVLKVTTSLGENKVFTAKCTGKWKFIFNWIIFLWWWDDLQLTSIEKAMYTICDFAPTNSRLRIADEVNIEENCVL